MYGGTRPYFVRRHMFFYIGLLCKCSTTYHTLIRLLSCVRTFMLLPVELLCKLFIAIATFVLQHNIIELCYISSFFFNKNNKLEICTFKFCIWLMSFSNSPDELSRKYVSLSSKMVSLSFKAGSLSARDGSLSVNEVPGCSD